MERDLNPPFSRSNITIWLRRTHGWIGLWGATLGLLFGTSGIWLNHRSVLQLQQEQERSNFQLPLPDPGPVDAQTMAAWLQLMLALPQQATNVRVEPAKPVAWIERAPRRADGAAAQGARGGDADRGRNREREREQSPPAASAPASASASSVPAAAPARAASGAASAPKAASPAALMQPEHWMINFNAPKFSVQAEYWAGNRSVSIRRTDNGFIAVLTSLHKGVGMPVAWILLVDTLAGSLILLSLSGLALWMLTRRKRVVGLAIFGTALAVTAGLALAHL